MLQSLRSFLTSSKEEPSNSKHPDLRPLDIPGHSPSMSRGQEDRSAPYPHSPYHHHQVPSHPQNPDASFELIKEDAHTLQTVMYHETYGLAFVGKTGEKTECKYHLNNQDIVHLVVQPPGEMDFVRIELFHKAWKHIVRAVYLSSEISGLDVVLHHIPRQSEAEPHYSGPSHPMGRGVSSHSAMTPYQLVHLQLAVSEPLPALPEVLDMGEVSDAQPVKVRPLKSIASDPVPRISRLEGPKRHKKHKVDEGDQMGVAQLLQNLEKLMGGSSAQVESSIESRTEPVGDQKVKIYSLGLWSHSHAPLLIRLEDLREALEPGLGHMTDVSLDMENKSIVVEWLASRDALRGVRVALIQREAREGSLSKDLDMGAPLKADFKKLLIQLDHVQKEVEEGNSDLNWTPPIKKPQPSAKALMPPPPTSPPQQVGKKRKIQDGSDMGGAVRVGESVQNYIRPKFERPLPFDPYRPPVSSIYV